jgi:hypothetical protein
MIKVAWDRATTAAKLTPCHSGPVGSQAYPITDLADRAPIPVVYWLGSISASLPGLSFVT